MAVVAPQESAENNDIMSDDKLIRSVSFMEGTQSKSFMFPTHHTSNEETHQQEAYQTKYNTYKGLSPTALVRSFITPNVTLNSNEFAGAPWLATDANSLAILNTMSLTDSSTSGMVSRDGIYNASRLTNGNMMFQYPATICPRPDALPTQGKHDLNGNSYFISENKGTLTGAAYSYYDHAQEMVLPEVGPYQTTSAVNTITPLRINTAGSRDVQISEVGV